MHWNIYAKSINWSNKEIRPQIKEKYSSFGEYCSELFINRAKGKGSLNYSYPAFCLPQFLSISWTDKDVPFMGKEEAKEGRLTKSHLILIYFMELRAKMVLRIWARALKFQTIPAVCLNVLSHIPSHTFSLFPLPFSFKELVFLSRDLKNGVENSSSIAMNLTDILLAIN